MVSQSTDKQAEPQVQVEPEAVAKPQAADEPEAAPAERAAIDPDQVEAWAELHDLIQRAKKGDTKTLPRLREFLAKNHFLWKSVGNISLEAQVAWVNLTCGDNLYLRECMLRQINVMKSELAGKAASPIEKLLAERVVMGTLQLGYLEAKEAQQGEKDLRWAEYQRRRQDQAYKQFMGAASALATLRRLVPQQTVYVPLPVMQQPAAVNGAPQSNFGRGERQEHEHVNGHQKINGNGKVNGHNRFGHLLDAVGANGNG